MSLMGCGRCIVAYRISSPHLSQSPAPACPHPTDTSVNGVGHFPWLALMKR